MVTVSPESCVCRLLENVQRGLNGQQNLEKAINAVDNKGKTPLHYAVAIPKLSYMSRFHIYQLLGSSWVFGRLRGARAHQRHFDRHPRPSWASEAPLARIFHHACIFRRTPLDAASFKGVDEVVELLLDRGANANNVDDLTGRTPLMAAALHDHRNVVEVSRRISV